MTAETETTSSAPRVREVPGKWVVLGMLLLGIAATTVMYVYWDLHTKPFRPLTEAIGRTFAHSLPKVEGGRHKKGPVTLRIVMRVPFPPEVDEPAATATITQLKELIRTHADLTGYERIQIHLIQMVPEELAKTRLFELTPADVQGSHEPETP